MIIVSGKTFDIKERLKMEGGRWNAKASQWEFEYILAAFKHELEQMVGVIVREERSKPKPVLDQEKILRIFNETFNEPITINSGKVHVHGDDPYTYLNHFAPGKPISFFGFSSLSAITKYIENLPDDLRNGTGWEVGNDDFTGSYSMKDALKLARRGWNEGVEIANKISEELTGINATQKRNKYAVTGSTVNVARMLSGNPLHMRSRPKQPGKKIVSLFVEVGSICVIKTKILMIRAALIAAISDILENKGFQCEIIATDFAKANKRSYSQIAVTLKQAGEVLRLHDIVFGLGHPSFARRMMFACVGSDRALMDIWESMGWPDNAFTEDHPPAENEFFINNLTSQQQRLIDEDGDAINIAKQIWKMIAPNNFPIEMNMAGR